MTIPNFYRLEHSMGAIPSYDRFLSKPLNFHDSGITLPDRPGLGYDLNLEAIAAAAVPGWND